MVIVLAGCLSGGDKGGAPDGPASASVDSGTTGTAGTTGTVDSGGTSKDTAAVGMESGRPAECAHGASRSAQCDPTSMGASSSCGRPSEICIPLASGATSCVCLRDSATQGCTVAPLQACTGDIGAPSGSCCSPGHLCFETSSTAPARCLPICSCSDPTCSGCSDPSKRWGLQFPCEDRPTRKALCDPRPGAASASCGVAGEVCYSDGTQTYCKCGHRETCPSGEKCEPGYWCGLTRDRAIKCLPACRCGESGCICASGAAWGWKW